MSTKLEAMIGLLAGRGAEPALLDELADPASEASQFLEATRSRSRSLIAGPESPEPAPGPAPRRLAPAWVVVALVAALGLAAWAGVALDRRFRLLEADLAARSAEARLAAARLEAAIASQARPRVEFAEILKRIEAAQERADARPEPSELDPALAEIRAGLAQVRRDAEAADKAESVRAEELRAEVHEAARLLKLLLTRSLPLAPTTEPPRPAGNAERRIIP